MTDHFAWFYGGLTGWVIGVVTVMVIINAT